MNSTIFLTSDERIMYQNALNPSVKLVLIGSRDQNSPQIQSMVSATTLTPPYDALEQILDGDVNIGYSMYYNDLLSHKSRKTISVLLTCLLKGFNVILYIRQHERELFCHVLESFLANELGIIVGTENRPFSKDMNKKWIIDSWMYEFEYLDAQTFLSTFPKGYQIPDNCLERLMNEFNPYLPNATIDDVRLYFYNLKESILANNNQYLVNPFINRMGETNDYVL